MLYIVFYCVISPPIDVEQLQPLSVYSPPFDTYFPLDSSNSTACISLCVIPVTFDCFNCKQDPEALVQALSQHLMSVLDAVLYGTTDKAIAVVFPPLCYMAPRVLLRCLRYLSSQAVSSFHLKRQGSISINGTTPHNNNNNNNNTHYSNPPNIPHGKGTVGAMQTKEFKMLAGEERAKLLRAVVSCQQSLTLLFESRYIGTYRCTVTVIFFKKTFFSILSM